MRESKSLNAVWRLVSEVKSIFSVAGKSKKRRSTFGSMELLGVENLEAREVPSASGFSGQVAVISAPTTVAVGKLEDNKNAKFFSEQSNITLTNQVTVDASRVGTYSASGVGGSTLESTFKPATILAGTKVNSYYLHADKVGALTTFNQYKGSITFSESILGVVTTRNNLNASDRLGSITTLYPKSGRELDATDTVNRDSFTISQDRKTLSFTLLTANYSDDIRIITSVTPLSDLEINNVFLKAPEATTNNRTLAISAPATVEVNKLENADYAMFFAEKTGVTLSTNLNVDASVAGAYNLASGLTPATILAGTKINSYYLHADRVDSPTTFDKISGSVTFDTPILGVIATKDNLNFSDALGADGTVYSKTGRTFDTGTSNLDRFWISADMKTLRYELQTSTACDDLRIITGVQTIPSAPSSLTATASSDGVVKLDWKAPVFDGFSAIKNYLVEYTSDGGKTWAQVQITNPECLQISIMSLTSGMDYGFRVSASNSKGNSLYSDAVYVTVV